MSGSKSSHFTSSTISTICFILRLNSTASSRSKSWLKNELWSVRSVTYAWMKCMIKNVQQMQPYIYGKFIVKFTEPKTQVRTVKRTHSSIGNNCINNRFKAKLPQQKTLHLRTPLGMQNITFSTIEGTKWKILDQASKLIGYT